MKKLTRADLITIDPATLGGTPVFKGTRVPVSILFEYLQNGSVEEFLKGYPHISRQVVNAVLMLAAKKFTQKPRRAAHEVIA